MNFRSAILWVLGEYSERVPKIAPDVLRKMAKTFPNEDPQVSFQLFNYNHNSSCNFHSVKKTLNKTVNE